MGFAVVGGTQILTSIGSQYGGNVSGTVPKWLRNFAGLDGATFGVGIPPVVILWIALAMGVALVMRKTWFGRSVYALGGNRSAARLALISEPRRWTAVFVLSGFFSSLTGVILLGFSGGGFVGVGDPYLFLTVAAVAVGGTSLLGGRGGYGSTVLGVLVLTVLTSLLVGWGLDSNAQQVVLGLLIVPIVGVYARAPHVRYRI
jgi:ribose transport system permease protein